MANINIAWILLAFLLVGFIESSSVKSPSLSRLSKRWAGNYCIARCPDAVNKTWKNPCGSCDHSQCKYEGCLYYGAFFTSWKPDPCTHCYCQGGFKYCTTNFCNEELDCYGYPKVKRPGKCCEECDFGDSEDACSLIPVRYEPYKYDTSVSCSKVVKHDCDKLFVYSEGKYYRCLGNPGYSKASNSPGCEEEEGWYGDITECQQKEVTDFSFMPADYDPNPTCYPLPPE